MFRRLMTTVVAKDGTNTIPLRRELFKIGTHDTPKIQYNKIIMTKDECYYLYNDTLTALHKHKSTCVNVYISGQTTRYEIDKSYQYIPVLIPEKMNQSPKMVYLSHKDKKSSSKSDKLNWNEDKYSLMMLSGFTMMMYGIGSSQ